MTTPHRTLLHHLDALEPCVSEEGPEQHELDAARDSLAALREALAADHLRDVAEKVAPAAPVPDGWVPLMAVLQEVRYALAPVSEYGLPGTRDVDQARLKHVVAMIDRAIAAAPAPAAPVVPLTDERITKALRRAFSLGQTYWQQADSDSYTQNAKSDETRQKFETLIVETLNGITGGSK